MIDEIIKKLEKEINLRKNMSHPYEQVDICYGLNRAKELVSSFGELTWIPVSEQMPADGTRVLATIKHHKWISDYNSNWVPDDEKTVHKEYTETCEAIYFENIGWEYRDMEGDAAFSAEYAFVSPEADISSPVDEVLAWMLLPEPYQPADGKEDNSEP